MKNGLLQWLLPVVMSILALLASGYMGYTSTATEMAVKIRALEVHQTDDSSRLERVENKIDALDGKINQILQSVQ